MVPGSRIIEINNVIKRYSLFSGVDELGAKIAYLNGLSLRINRMIKDETHTVFIVGHLAQELSIKYDIIVVKRLNLKELLYRLRYRKYPAAKIRENLIAEALDYCGVKAQSASNEVYEIESEASISKIKSYIRSVQACKATVKPTAKQINHMKELAALAKKEKKIGI
ncbi:MAG: hypothetical protein M1364_02460 [Candidatus Marsarchaeota archaeon]|nr:hypothetical protein [Candidatus Marsarchaeota archaeon]